MAGLRHGVRVEVAHHLLDHHHQGGDTCVVMGSNDMLLKNAHHKIVQKIIFNCSVLFLFYHFYSFPKIAAAFCII
jgi:hypothetical protein